MPQSQKKVALVVGGGGREHGLARGLARSCAKVYVAQGNAGTALMGGNVENVSISKEGFEHYSEYFRALATFARENGVTLTVVGPEDPLAHGIVDYFESQGLTIFGPTVAAAFAETSKTFGAVLREEEGIPTARSRRFVDFNSALAYIQGQKLPLVIKPNGLTAGKGVTICGTPASAERTLRDMLLDHVYGEAGGQVCIDEFLHGFEISVHVLTDGITHRTLIDSMDHKRLEDGDKGPNTGGMGVIAPVPGVTPELMERVEREIIIPTLQGLRKRNRTFKGCLYFGLMITPAGPKVLEYNVRWGDPETEALLALFKSDLYDVLYAVVKGTLGSLPPFEWYQGHAFSIVIAAKGYPNKPQKGMVLSGIEDAERVPGVIVFHAGTKLVEGKVIANGGRLLVVTATGDIHDQARGRAYEAASRIRSDQPDTLIYRHDIGIKARRRAKQLA